MAHNLATTADGRVMMAYRKNGGLPWHGLGVALPDKATPEEMMIAAGLDWEVGKFPTTFNFNGQEVLTGDQALVRMTDGKKLTTVSEGWEPVQNKEAFEFFDDFVKAGQMEMETAGALRDGQIIWAQANLDDGFTLFGGDEVKGHLLFSNPHQYGATVSISLVSTRVVCNNTLTLALSEKGGRRVNVNHRKKFDAAHVKQLMGLADTKMTRFKEAGEFLGTVKVDSDKLRKYAAALFGEKENGELTRNGTLMIEAFEKQPGTEFAPGSMWQAFNAVTFCTNHVFGRTNDRRMESVWYGEADRLNTKALNLAIEMAGDSI